jgi:tryptophanase
MSAKKDGLSHIGGWIALNNDELATQIEDNLFISEGFKTYGGMAGRDLDIVAEGLKEVIDYSYLNHRFEVNERLIEQISQMNIPVLKPVCGHAIFIDAKAYLPHIPCHEYPAQALCIAIYIEGGIRTCEIGSLSSEHATIELVRFCIPRKVYSEDQLSHVVKTLKKIKINKEKLTGYKLIKCGKVFRQFTAVIEKLSNNK